jgi:NADH dehydrogenase (ubiquinone) 1 beta subcomplex subunit 7
MRHREFVYFFFNSSLFSQQMRWVPKRPHGLALITSLLTSLGFLSNNKSVARHNHLPYLHPFIFFWINKMSPPVMKVTPQEMADHHVPMHVRDYCAHILIPLNICRRKTLFFPNACAEDMHSYEICMYKEYERRRTMKQGK